MSFPNSNASTKVATIMSWSLVAGHKITSDLHTRRRRPGLTKISAHCLLLSLLIDNTLRSRTSLPVKRFHRGSQSYPSLSRPVGCFHLMPCEMDKQSQTIPQLLNLSYQPSRLGPGWQAFLTPPSHFVPHIAHVTLRPSGILLRTS